jgi:hypothetical protein
MIIQQDFHPLPPRMFMEQIMDSLSKFYCFLWDKRDKLNRIRLTWKEMSVYYNKNTVHTSLRKLNNVGLISYSESDKGIAVELVGWDEVSDDE